MKRKSANTEVSIDVSGSDLSAFGSCQSIISNFFRQHAAAATNNTDDDDDDAANCTPSSNQTILSQLNISQCRLGPNGTTSLLSFLSNNSESLIVKQINLQRNGIGSIGGRAVGTYLSQNDNNTSCTCIDISLNDIQAGNSGPLAMEQISSGLANNTTLTTLIMNKCALGPSAGIHIANALKVNTSLKVLRLEGNMIGPIGGKKLFDGLRENKTLEELDLRMNRIGGGGDDDEEKADVKSLAFALGNNSDGKCCCQLIKLDLSYNDLRCLGCIILAEAIGKSSQCTLRELILEKNDIGGMGAVSLANSLTSNAACSSSRLHCLVLRGNAIGDVGAIAIGMMLKKNDSLRVLDVSSCSIGNEGAAAVGMGLSVNTTLQTLNLDKNSLGSGINYVLFSEGVSTNKTLKALHLSGNGLTDDADQDESDSSSSVSSSWWGKAVAKALCTNTSLQYLNLSNNALSEGAIIEAVANHPSLATVNLSDNEFESISIETQLKLAERMTTLEMDLMFNKLSSPPLGRLADSYRLKCYLTLLASEKAAVTRIRLMVCGFGGVGKSTFARAITSVSDQSDFEASLSPVVEWGTDRLIDWASRLGTVWAEDAAQLIGDEGITGKDLELYVDCPSDLHNICSSKYPSIEAASFAKAIAALCTKGYLSTVGVVKVEGQVTIGDDRTVSLVDFAGQSEFLVSHQLLLSSLHTLCLIIQPAPSFEQSESGSWEYWNKFLRSLGDRRRGSLLLAVSQLDKVGAGKDSNFDSRELISNEFNRIKEQSSGAISCNEALRLDYRRGSIDDTINRAKQALSKSTNEVAHSWWVPNSYETLSKIAQELAKTKSANHELPILTRDQLIRAINDYYDKVPQSSAFLIKLTTDPQLLQKAIEYMEAVGDVMQAGGQLLIDPIGWFSQFLTHFIKDDLAVSTIQIDNSELRQQRGTVHLDSILRALEHEYVSPREHIAQIMELLCDLELCVPLCKTSFLFPCLLPPLSTSVELLDEGFLNSPNIFAVRGHRFRESSGFIPPGLFLGIVARLWQVGAMHPNRMWKDAAVMFLNNNATRVLLRCYPDQSIIDVIAFAPSSELLFVGAAKGQASVVIWLVHSIKMFLRNYSQLKFDEFWLCTNPECHGIRDGATRYSYQGSEFPLSPRAAHRNNKSHDCNAEGCLRFIGVGHSVDAMQWRGSEGSAVCTTCGNTQVFRLRDVIHD